MNTEIIGLVLDGLVLTLLAATIFIAWWLSENINAFRKGRKDLDKLVQDLSRNIDKAELAITGMKSATRDAGKDLQGLVNEARALSEELQLMTASGDNLASRLERLAERNRDIAERVERAGGSSMGLSSPQSALKRVQEDRSVPTGPFFAIRDKDFGTKAEPEDEETAEEWSSPDSLHSKAERELRDAVRKSKPNAGRVS
ncbi:MAG TPA: DUF6468 domain-containing protein [Micavibrio sp.]